MKSTIEPPPGAEYLTPEQVAIRLQVAHSTVLRWINDGMLRAVNVSGSIRPRWRIKHEWIEAFELGRANVIEKPSRVSRRRRPASGNPRW